MPMAIVVMPAICTIRLTKFREVRNASLWLAKTMTMMTSPSSSGSEPSSPARRPAMRPRAYAARLSDASVAGVC
jgi:hypothetical protein